MYDVVRETRESARFRLSFLKFFFRPRAGEKNDTDDFLCTRVANAPRSAVLDDPRGGGGDGGAAEQPPSHILEAPPVVGRAASEARV